MWGPGAGGVLRYLSSLGDPVSSSALAFFTTLHLALALLRKERSFGGGFRLLLLPSFVFTAAPWLLPSPLGLTVGLLSHLAWFTACEKLLPVAAPAAPRPASGARTTTRPEAATPFSPSRASSPSAPPPGFVATPVLAVFDETPEIRTFRLVRPKGFEFRAGQFLSVRIPAGSKTAVRCYTISSSPDARGYLEISVKRQGLVSSTLHATVRPGTTLEVRGPGGKFLYPSGEDRPIALLGGGVGITPLMSMLRYAVANEPDRSVTLLYSVRTERDIAFRTELAGIVRRNPQVRLVLAASRGTEDPELFPGRIDEKLLRNVISNLLRPLYFVCGPVPMIEEMKRLLAGAGVPEAQVHAEAFEAAVAWASAPASAAARRPAAAASGGGRGRPGATTWRLVLCRSGKTTGVSPSQTLLEAAEEAGAGIDSSCRSGACGTCRTRLLRGAADGEGGALSPEERAQGWILPCISFPRADCEMDA